MTIRARLAYWYGGVMLLSVILLGGAMYYELVVEPAIFEARGKATDPMLEEIGEVLLFYAVPTSVMAVFGGWWLLRRALAPLDKLAAAAERLHVHNLREPLPHTGSGDEVDRLAEVLNATHARLEAAFGRIQEFTLRASHELKTPLTVLHGAIESALSDPATTPAQREAFASQLDEIQRLTKIVEGLILLARSDTGQLVLTRERVRLDELVRDSFADTQILAQPGQIRVSLEHCDTVTVCGDRHRLRQLLLSLMDNAIKYNQPRGCVSMALTHNRDGAEFRIANTGRGIPASMLPRVFDRFTRGDASGNHEVEGCGLGLSIARSIVIAHGGEIEIASAPDQLTTVKVRLPLAPD